ncbi:hypothetical protein IM774_01320 [Erysipelotrichaceae bacterium RD49]|nr:hypothetical protein [Erysipelotrichaceae bacterium RD49]
MEFFHIFTFLEMVDEPRLPTEKNANRTGLDTTASSFAGMKADQSQALQKIKAANFGRIDLGLENIHQY